MNFEPTEERRMLRETLTRFLADHYPIGHRNAVAYTAPFHDPTRWTELVELGILHALAPEAQGGFGGGGFDITTVFESLGNALCPEPVLGTLLAARILGATGGDLGPLLTGSRRYAVALDRSNSVTANETNNRWVLNGRCDVVYGGGTADRLLVATDTGAVFKVYADAVQVTPYGMIDGGGAAMLVLDNTPATLIALNGRPVIQDACDVGALALCAEAVGAMNAGAAMLLEYLKTRQQFGKPIGEFQVLQHRMVNLMTEIEQARSITILAASRLGTDTQSRISSMAKSLIGRTALLVAEELIQMQGGIAMTWDCAASHFAKRLVMIDHQLGDTDRHLQFVANAY